MSWAPLRISIFKNCISASFPYIKMMNRGDKFSTPMEAHELYKKGVIVLRRTFVQDDMGRKYKVVRFGEHCGGFCLWVEFPNGNHEPLDSHKIKMLNLEIVPEKGVRVSDWEDPP